MLLRVLGTLALDPPDRPAAGAAAQRRPLALLAVLAAAGARGVPRERVQALLWPDRDADHARGALNQALYALRRDTGARTLVTGGPVLALDPSVGCDLWTFERAAAAGDVDAALGAYGGPFLDGVTLSRAVEFERWADAERARVEARLARLLADGAAAAARAGDLGRAAVLRERRAALDPLDAGAAAAWVAALAAAGDAEGARRAAAHYADGVRRELGGKPDPAVAAALATAPAAAPAAPPIAFPSASPTHPAAPPRPEAEPAPLGAPPPRGPAADATAFGGLPSLDPPPAAPPPAAPPSDGPTLGGPALGGSALGPRPPGAPRARPARRRAALGAALAAAALLAAVFARRTPREAGARAGAGVAAGTAARPTRWAEAVPPGDPRRIAVLYFDDHSPGRTLGYLADGLTEELIEQLAQVPGLRVPSRNAVKPFRDRPAPFDSLVRALGVGTVVEGSVQRSAGRLRVTVQVIDAAANTHLASRTFERPDAELFALQDDLAQQVSTFLRRRLGEEAAAQATHAEAHDARALELVLRAERERKDAAALARTGLPADRARAAGALSRADSLLAAADRFDPTWARVHVARARVAMQRAETDTGQARVAGYAAAVRAAEQAVADAPNAAEPLEVRGTARWRLLAVLPNGRLDTAGVRRAADDLRHAVERDSTRAGAWAAWSKLSRWNGDPVLANRLGEQALNADAYLDAAGDIYSQLWRSAEMLGDGAAARRWCARAHAALPDDYRFVECELLLLVTAPSPPNPRRAWQLVGELDRMDPAPLARAAGRGYVPIFRRLRAATVSAAAGERDSARAVLVDALRRAAPHAEWRVDVLFDAAILSLALGDSTAARHYLVDYLVARPENRGFVDRNASLRHFGFDATSLPPLPSLRSRGLIGGVIAKR